MEVVYEGIRLTPAQIAASALQEGVHVVGLSILSGSHRELIPSVMEALREAGVGDVPVIVGGIIPVADEAPLKEPASPPSTRRRTSTSRASCATSSRSSPSATARGHGLSRPGHPVVTATESLAAPTSVPSMTDGSSSAHAAGGDLRAPAVLNLVESRAPAAQAEIAALLAAVAPGALGGEAAGHIVGVTGPPGAGKSTLLSQLVAGWRARGRSVAVLAVDPSSKRSGGALLGDRARIDYDPADERDLHPLDGRRRPPRRPRPRHARGRARARGRVRRRRDRDGRRRPVGDGGRGGRGHRRRRRAAGLRRRAAVPQERDHGDPRRARRDEGRPRPGRRVGAARPARGAALARRARHGRRRGQLDRAAAGDRRDCSTRSTRTGSRATSPRGACARAACTRSPTSPPSTARAACARSAAAARPSAGWRSRTPGLDVPALERALAEHAGRRRERPSRRPGTIPAVLVDLLILLARSRS